MPLRDLPGRENRRVVGVGMTSTPATPLPGQELWEPWAWEEGWLYWPEEGWYTHKA